MTTLASENHPTAREITTPVVEALRPFTEMDETDISSAVCMAGLLCARDHTATKDDLGVMMGWADNIHGQATLLRMVLAGAIDVCVKDGEIHYGLPGLDMGESLRRLVAAGMATESCTVGGASGGASTVADESGQDSPAEGTQ